MRKLITILLFSFNSYGQDYVVNWTSVKKEPGLVNYQVQLSTDGLGGWTTKATIQPKRSYSDSNRYTYTLPVANNYVRVKALFTNTVVYTPVKKIVNTNVAISNPVLKINITSDNLSFTATNEGQASYYAIQRKNSSSSQWVLVGKLTQTNKKNYVVNISKVGSLRSYRLQVVYYNGIVGPYISFE